MYALRQYVGSTRVRPVVLLGLAAALVVVVYVFGYANLRAACGRGVEGACITQEMQDDQGATPDVLTKRYSDFLVDYRGGRIAQILWCPAAKLIYVRTLTFETAYRVSDPIELARLQADTVQPMAVGRSFGPTIAEGCP
jgi:hypothetical protein